MLRKLILVRHGVPEWIGPDGDDFSRRLTPRGEALLRTHFGNELAPLLRNDKDVAIWSSPAPRALRTAELAAEALGLDDAGIETFDTLYDQEMGDFMVELEAMQPTGTLVVVGHVPFMERYAWLLTGEDVPFYKGSACCIEMTDGSYEKGRLRWVIQGD